MKTEQINIRDPFVLLYDGKYYLYGTRGETAFANHAEGLDVYISEDKNEWEGPIPVFQKKEGFWADRHFWAPEVYHYNDAFYMFVTFAAGKKKQGTVVLKAEKPDGEFVEWSDQTITPADELCLDGTLYLDRDKTPYMVYCREWKEVRIGQIWAVQLDKELKKPVAEPFMLFKAAEAKPLVKSFLLGNYVTDGPFFARTEDDRLHMLWSSYGKGGYVQLMAHKTSEDLTTHFVTDAALYTSDGGHGMIFKDKDNSYCLVLHTPNKLKHEHPVFIPLTYKDKRFLKAN